MLHGALMPMSLPNLLVGDDVPVYAPNNTGRTYKLGYAAGVNVCGLIFFGFFFWRIRRWKEDPSSMTNHECRRAKHGRQTTNAEGIRPRRICAT